MPLKSVSLECINDDCDANQRGQRIDDFFRVESLDELQSGTPVDMICKECGQQLRVAFSGCRISFGGTSNSATRLEEPQDDQSDGHPDGHQHIHLVRRDDPDTEVVVSLETGKGWLKTKPGSRTHREILGRGVEPDARTLTPISPADGENRKDLN